MSYINEWDMNNQAINNNQAIGVYTPFTQFNIDYNMMFSLGFTFPEITTLQNIIASGGKMTPQALASYGMSYDEAKKIKYMYDIATGKINIESPEDLVKHLRKTFGNHTRIGIGNLILSKINKVPRKAVIAGIEDETFKIYNSKNMPLDQRMYDVVDVTQTRIHIETSKRPVLKWKQSKKVDGVIEILETKDDGNIVLAVNKDYIRLCNRFIILAGLRKPEFHHGLIEIICIEGTTVYVYAQSMGTKEHMSYSGGTQRVYDYGFYSKDIQPKLIQAASDLYQHLCGVYATETPSNMDFTILEPEKPVETIDDIIED